MRMEHETLLLICFKRLADGMGMALKIEFVPKQNFCIDAIPAKGSEMNLLASENIDFINLKLNQLLEETVITKEDDEKTAIHKTLSREAACALARNFTKKCMRRCCIEMERCERKCG